MMQLRGSCCVFLICLLILPSLAMSDVQTMPPVSGETQSVPELPDGLWSALLAASAEPFAVSDEGHSTAAGGLEFTLHEGGLQATGEGLTWGLTLSGWGRGEQIVALPEATIVQTDSRLEYRRGLLTEWYRGTALGMEQGVTIDRAPGGAGVPVLRFDLATGLTGVADADGRGLSFAAADGQRLRYDHLQAWDAEGTELDAVLHYMPGQVAIQVEDQGAAYPITIDPLIYVEPKVVVSDEDDFFGCAVALSSDGNTALVGVYHDDVGSNANQGSAYVFVRSGTAWNLQGQLIAADAAAGDLFGFSVALSGDGNTALVGASGDDVGANFDQGSAYVFVRSGTSWIQQGKLTAEDGAEYDRFGHSVAMGDGNTALVGAVFDDVGTSGGQGSAYVFVRSGTTWSMQQKLIASDGAAEDTFGVSVALLGDTALVGAFYDDVGANANQGSAYVFVRSGTTWSEQQKLTAGDGVANDLFGVSVALSGDGNTALIGAAGDDDDQGSAYVFVRGGTIWSEQQKLTALDGAANDQFGHSVALSGDTALVGAYWDDIDTNADQGSAYVFVRSGTSWSQRQKLTASDGAAYDYFGHSTALSGDGNTALVGAYWDDVGANADQGSAYVFVCEEATWSEEQQLTGTVWGKQQRLAASDGAGGDEFGYAVALSGDTALVGAYHDDVGANADQGSAYVFVRSGTTWSLQQQLIAPDGAAEDGFGAAVALSGDTALVGASGNDVGANADQGSAYVFVRSGATWSLQQQLIASDGATEDGFGTAVALSDDMALVGASGDDVGVNANQGSAYVFIRSGTTWGLQQQLTASDGATEDGFGGSVALSGDGNTVLVGASADDIGANGEQGSATVFVHNETTWSEQRLTASDGAAGDRFGGSVALSSDGNTALVGASQDDLGANSDQGSATVFVRSGTTWSEQQRLIAGDGAGGDRFGVSVTLSGDGDTALVGASQDDVDANGDQGSATVFVRRGTSWSEQRKLMAGDGAADDGFGNSVALSSDGNTALVGAPWDDVGADIDQGSAHACLLSTTYLPLVLRNASS